MNDEHPSPLELLAASIRDDPEGWLPPDSDAPGPDRLTELADGILERERARDRGAPAGTSGPGEPPGASRSRGRLLLVAAAVVVTAAVGIVLAGPSAPPAYATVVVAAEALGDIEALEGSLTRSSPSRTSESTFRANGAAFQLRSEATYADGHVEASEQVLVDGYLYETIDGQTSRTLADPEQVPAPFARSSSAVISAATTGADVEDLGSEDLGAVSARRYDIRLGPDSVEALSKLERSELAWFELEYPERVDTMRVWIADGVIRQMELRSADQTTRIEFHNLGQEVDIDTPPGPYAD